MRRPPGFQNSAIILLALCAASCDGTTEPASATLLTAVTATPLTGTVGTEVLPAPVVRATDAHGRAVAGVRITFLVGDGGELAMTVVRTDGDGLASVGRWTLGPYAKAQTLTARAAGVADVVFTATAVAGPVSRVEPVSGMNQMAIQGSPLAEALRIRVVDEYGNPVAGAPVTFTVTAGGGTISPGPAATDTAGVAVSGVWTLGPDSGEQHVRASSGPASELLSAFVIQPHPGLQGRLAFASVSGYNAEIYAMNADGTELERFTAHAGEGDQPVWTPSGDKITFVSYREGSSGIYTMGTDGSNLTRLTPDQTDSNDPSWSRDPDATVLAYTSWREGSADVVSLETGTGVVSVLAESPDYEGQPAWSPDGRRLAFVSDREASHSRLGALDIYTINADGTGLVRITESVGLGRFYQHPAWSPDGTLIAFVWGEYTRIPPDPTIRFHVAVMAPDGSGVRDLALAGEIRHEWLDPESLAWSPDGRGIAFSFADCEPTWIDYESFDPRCATLSVKYVSLAGGEAITLIPYGHSPSWR